MADGFGIDTSSYPKPVATQPINPLDTLSKITAIQQGQQNLQSGNLFIQKQQMDLVNQRFGNMVKDFTALTNNPNLNEDMIRKRIETDVKLGIVTPDMAGTFINQLPPTQGMPQQQVASTLKNHLETWLNHAMTINEALNAHYGQQGIMDTGQSLQPIATSPLFGVRSTGLPIQKQLPPTTPFYPTGSGQQQYVGPNPNAVAMPPAAPGSNIPLPVARPTTGPTGPTVERPDLEPANFAQRFNAAPPPLFEEGKKQLTEDQVLATSRLQGAKPAIQALKLMPGLQTGPGTEQFNNLMAAAKAWGIVNTQAENDPTVLRQELEKKLAQYVGSNPIGQRSDAAQILAEAGSPNPKKQILPALIDLTRDAVALDRIQAARATSFTNSGRTDLQNYGAYRATFPQSIDERAFKLDLMDQGDRQKLVQSMLNKYQKNPRDPEAIKFLRSYDIAKKQGFTTDEQQ